MKPEIDEGMFAFPWKSEEFGYMCRGMELRDYFAAAALPAVYDFNMAYVKVHTQYADKLAQMVASDCYEIADAMIAERQK